MISRFIKSSNIPNLIMRPIESNPNGDPISENIHESNKPKENKPNFVNRKGLRINKKILSIIQISTHVILKDPSGKKLLRFGNSEIVANRQEYKENPATKNPIQKILRTTNCQRLFHVSFL